MAGKVWAAEWEASAGSEGTADNEAVSDAALFSFSPGAVETAMQTRIRGVSKEDFPSVERFVTLHEEGKLKSPRLPAAEIAAFLERDDAEPFHEARLD